VCAQGLVAQRVTCRPSVPFSSCISLIHRRGARERQRASKQASKAEQSKAKQSKADEEGVHAPASLDQFDECIVRCPVLSTTQDWILVAPGIPCTANLGARAGRLADWTQPTCGSSASIVRHCLDLKSTLSASSVPPDPARRRAEPKGAHSHDLAAPSRAGTRWENLKKHHRHHSCPPFPPVAKTSSALRVVSPALVTQPGGDRPSTL
jgi:hypothetical protein